MRTSLMAALIMTTCVAQAAAQDVPATPHEAAALELMEVMKLEQVSSSTMAIMIEQMIGQTPELVPVRDVIEGFFSEFMSWELLRPEYARIYMEAFTEPELRDLIAFYQTPTGRKLAEVNPKLVAESSAAGERLIQPHIGELQNRIMARMRQLQP